MTCCSRTLGKKASMQVSATLGLALVPLVLTLGAPRSPITGRRAARARSTCNAIVGDAPSVTSTNSSAKVPAAAGGAMSDGTYVLSSMTIYTALPFPGITLSALMQISGGEVQPVLAPRRNRKGITHLTTTP